MELKSDAFRSGEKIPKRYTCQGQNINPPLAWSNAPAGTKSFALIFDDPDAQRVVGYTWVHWLLKDIPANTTHIPENSRGGTEVQNSFNKTSYGGPCPPDGMHRYYLKIYALDTPDLSAQTSKQLYEQVQQHKISEATLMGTYQKD